MGQFVVGNFNTMNPQLLSPIQAALTSFNKMQQGLKAQQAAKQAGIETGFLPKQLQALLKQQQVAAQFAQPLAQQNLAQQEQASLQAKLGTQFLPSQNISNQFAGIASSISSLLQNPKFALLNPDLQNSIISQMIRFGGQREGANLQNPGNQYFFPTNFSQNNSNNVDYKPSDIAKTYPDGVIRLKNGKLIKPQ